MPRMKYKDIRITRSTRDLITIANSIIDEFAEQGYELTLRQLYYQFVGKDLIPNTQRSYNRLGDAIATGRNIGLIDWDAIVDRLRNVKKRSEWADPGAAIESLAGQYHIDVWENQPVRPEVWVEKDALSAIVRRSCNAYGVGYMVCRGYLSQTAAYNAGQRALKRSRYAIPQQTVILYLGDHDPSGLDMPRDINERVNLYAADHLARTSVKVKPIALNRDQIAQYGLPPNPAKEADSRAPDYVKRYGESSWELDALPPAALTEIIERAIVTECRNPELMQSFLEDEKREKAQLIAASKKWGEIEKTLGKKKPSKKGKKKPPTGDK